MATREGIRFLAGDIWDTPEDGSRYEVIDGRLCMTPPPGWAHQSAVGALQGIVWPFVREHNLGYVVPAPVGVVLDEENGLQPDLVFVSRERALVLSWAGPFREPQRPREHGGRRDEEERGR